MAPREIGKEWDYPEFLAEAGWRKEEAKRDARQGEGKPAAAPITLRGVNPADWEGTTAAPRLWVVPDYMPDRTVTLLYADGGTGKSYLKLQLAVARAVAREWIGLLPEPGRTLVLSTEDDIDEMHRRIEGIIPFYGARMADLGDIRLVDLVGENSVLGLLERGIIVPTQMYQALDAYIAEFKPGLVCLDVLADMFSGSENDRPQVTQFVGLLKKLCRKHSCAVLLLAQPSVAGMNTGTGTSGSTGWGNSGRSRLYFQRAKTKDGDEPNKDLRTFEGMKANYGALGGRFDVIWKEGLFQRLNGPTGFDKMAAEQMINAAFLRFLAKFMRERRDVSPNKSATYAPAVFSGHADNVDRFSSNKFAAAMDRLLGTGDVIIETIGPKSHERKRLILGEGSGNA